MSSEAHPATHTWLRFIGDVDRTPERSVPVRLLVLAALTISLVAATVAGAITQTTAGGAIVLMALGTLVADWRKDDRIPWLSIAATAVMLVLTVRFLLAHREVATPAELRAPLAELLVMMEAVRAFAMRSRRDLRFGLSSSAAIVAVGASMSLTMGFALPLAAWAILVAVGMAATHRGDLREYVGPDDGSGRRRGAARPIGALAGALGAAAAVAIAVFLVVPAAESSKFLSSVSHLPRQLPVPRQGGLSNPSLGDRDPAGGGQGEGTGDGAASYGYFGFATTLDTAVRGRPDDTLVMRVRASAPDFWRGQSFDTWDGRRWTMSDEQTRVLGGRGRITILPVPGTPPVPGSELIQTYFLEAGGPNVIFGASRPAEVYIPQSALFQLDDGTLRTGVELEAGSIYTVVSERPAATPARLRAAGDTSRLADDGLLSHYATQPGVPPRVAALAADVTAGSATTYDKVLALERWMGDNTSYSLDIPPLPAGADAVEQFLLVDRVGFCEQIATSLVVMLRSQGIPARLAVGYTPGERNPFTGLFEVRARDAHAWTEVYFPTVGWQAFDPTAEVPLAGEPHADAARQGLASYLAKRLEAHRRGIIAVVAGLIAALLVAIAWRPLRRVLARRAAWRAAPWADRTLTRLEDIGARLGRPRRPGETAAEYAEALNRTVMPDARLSSVAAAIERDAYGPEPIATTEREAAEQLVAELVELSR